MTVEARGTVAGLPAPLAPQTLTPRRRRSASLVGWDVTVPAGVASLGWDVEVGDARRPRRITCASTQQVRPAVPVRTLQATLAPVVAAKPRRCRSRARPTRSRIAAASRSRVAPIAGRRPRRRARLDAALSVHAASSSACRAPSRSATTRRGSRSSRALPAYQDGDGLLKYFPTIGARQRGPDRLRASRWRTPPAARCPATCSRHARTRSAGFVDGTLDASVAHGRTCRCASSRRWRRSRATAGRRRRSSRTHRRSSPRSGRRRRCSTGGASCAACPTLPDRAARLADVEQQLRARLDLTGHDAALLDRVADDLWWLMTGPDVNAARLVLAAPRARCLARRPAAARARRARAAAARALGHDDRERLGHARGRALRRRVRGRAGRRARRRRCSARQRDALAWSERPRGRRRSTSPGRPAAADLDRRARRDRRAVGDRRDARRRAAARAARERLPRHASTSSRSRWREPGTWHRRRPRCACGSRSRPQSDMTWVVVDDPVPAGASHLGTGLGATATARRHRRRCGRAVARLRRALVRRAGAPTTTSCRRDASSSSTPSA